MRYLWDSGDDVRLPHRHAQQFENEAVYSIKEGEPLSASVTVMRRSSTSAVTTTCGSRRAGA